MSLIQEKSRKQVTKKMYFIYVIKLLISFQVLIALSIINWNIYKYSSNK